MAWRVHLTNSAIQGLDILPGKSPLLVAWTGRDRATFFDLSTGALAGEHQHVAVARGTDRWPDFIAALVSPAGGHLPYVRTALFTLFTSDDGRMRLFWLPDDRLLMEMEGKEISLELNARAPLRAVGLDRYMGLVAALDAKGKLHLFQQHIRVGTVDLKLSLGDEHPPSLAVANGGAAVFVAQSRDLLRLDSGGRVKKRLTLHYEIGRLACSPNGRLLLTTDTETGVIRVYEGPELLPAHQRHAMDLLQDADQLQLIADLPPATAAPGALALADDGALAFAIFGVVCVSHTKHMDALPRPQPAASR